MRIYYVIDTTIKTAISIFCFVSFILISNTCAETLLTLSTFAGSPLSNKDQTGYYDQVIKEAFHRAGIPIEIIQLPAERSLANANQGITDGDFVRIAGLDNIYPNLLRVPEKITDFEFVGFSKNISIPDLNWESLKPYDIAIVRGWKILETNIVDSQSLVKTKDQYLLFSLLKKNRTDIVVYSRFEGYEMMHQLDITDAHTLEPPLATREMFLYLNKKHKALVPVIDTHLKNMKQDGSYDTIRMKALAPFMPGANNAYDK